MGFADFGRDNHKFHSYVDFMSWDGPVITLKLNTDDPIELGEFVGAFTALASQYDRFIRTEKPDADPEATLFVKEVRAGCIEAQLFPMLAGMASTAMVAIENANTIAAFVENYGKLLGVYLPKGGKNPDATVAQLKDFTDQVTAIANAPGGSSLEVAAIDIKDGEKHTKAAFKFDTTQAREIREHAETHRAQLEATNNATHSRVLMQFRRSDADSAKVGKRSGEMVRINSISNKKLPLIYASDLAERQIKHHIAEDSDNVFKKGFVVDVNVERRGDKPLAYGVMHLHQVIDLDDEDDS